jgi:hypothetical protein
MAKIEADPCPRCSRPVDVMPSEGGRGTGDLTSYSVTCVCGLFEDHFGDNGRLDNANRQWNRWAREQLGKQVRASRSYQASAEEKKFRLRWTYGLRKTRSEPVRLYSAI